MIGRSSVASRMHSFKSAAPQGRMSSQRGLSLNVFDIFDVFLFLLRHHDPKHGLNLPKMHPTTVRGVRGNGSSSGSVSCKGSGHKTWHKIWRFLAPLYGFLDRRFYSFVGVCFYWCDNRIGLLRARV